MDVASHGEARHRRFRSAKFLDGDRQGSKDRLGAAAAGALSGAPRRVDDVDPGCRAAAGGKVNEALPKGVEKATAKLFDG